MKEQNVHPDDIRELSDVTKLPFMFKRDLRDTYPDKIFTASQEELVRYHVSSGTTGKPTVVGYTQNDLNNWTTSLARALTSVGSRKGRCHTGQLWVRSVHRRARVALWCRKDRGNSNSNKCRQYRTPD